MTPEKKDELYKKGQAWAYSSAKKRNAEAREKMIITCASYVHSTKRATTKDGKQLTAGLREFYRGAVRGLVDLHKESKKK